METVELEAPSGWTDSERRLWAAFRRGETLKLGQVDPVTTQLPADYWNQERTVRASIVAHILLHGPSQEEGYPPRLVLSGARVTGRLDLGCGTASPFHFQNCLLDEAPFLNDSNADFVGFTSCILPGLQAERLKCN